MSATQPPLTEQKKGRSFSSAVVWAYLMNWGQKGFSALFSFVLAALLGPRDFGVVAMAMIYVNFCQMLLDQGLTAALIQRKEIEKEHLDAAFWMNMGAAGLFVVLSLLLSGWWARVNHVPELAKVISVLSICIPLEGLSIVQQAVLQKEMNFRGLSVRSNISVVAGGVVGIALAFGGARVWALVAQQLVRDGLALILLWKISHWRPRLEFSVQALRELWVFSTANMLAKIGVFANQQLDAILMGLFFGPIAVGLYRFAQRLMSMVVDLGTSSLQVVSFPQFARVRDNANELRRSFLNCVRMSSAVTFPSLVGLAFCSNLLMAAVGNKWMPAANALKILCVVGVVSSFTSFTGPLLQALAKPRKLALLTWFYACTWGAGMVATGIMLRNAPEQRQVVGVAASRLIMILLVSAPISMTILSRLSGASFRQMAAASAAPAASATAIATCVTVLQATGFTALFRPIVSLGIVIVVAGAAGVGTLLALDRDIRLKISRKIGFNLVPASPGV